MDRELNSLRSEVATLKAQMKQVLETMAEHLYGLSIGTQVYIDGTDRGAVSGLETDTVYVVLHGDYLARPFGYNRVSRS